MKVRTVNLEEILDFELNGGSGVDMGLPTLGKWRVRALFQGKDMDS